MYLAKEVPLYTSPANHPQEGKIGNGINRKGDFIFAVGNKGSIQPTSGPLYLTVKTSPEGVTVRILNIVPKYHAGIALKPDKSYQIEVTHRGYQRQIKTVSYQAGGKQVLSMVLEKDDNRVQPDVSDPVIIPDNGPQHGDSWTDPQMGIKMVYLQSGCFQMGSPLDEAERSIDEHQHKVCLSQGYYMGKYEVTQAQWQQVMGSNPSYFKCQQCPVEQVSWDDIQDFIHKLNRESSLQYRLPTEAEWEYAARAGSTSAFSFGNNISTNQVNYDGNYPYNGAAEGQYREKTVPVGSLPVNAWGLHEMHGNVWEWVSDWYWYDYDYDEQSPKDNPKGPSSGSRRVLRCGGWFLYNASGARSAYRDLLSPVYRLSFLGFRLARTQN